jgi:hypothetical protein
MILKDLRKNSRKFHEYSRNIPLKAITKVVKKQVSVAYVIPFAPISYVKGNGYGFFFVATFSFLKSIQIYNLPFFLSTITMGDNHVASFID